LNSGIARFEAERQALALMDHPNIAKVFNAGCAEDGLPHLFMELLKGVPIMQYWDDRLTTHERLKVFVQVFQAMQHAHQKGMIHRDLKPSNVMVAITMTRRCRSVFDRVCPLNHDPPLSSQRHGAPPQTAS
jgi:non-specific serine/threonine protein kinase/serine/threonine-protein kinase